MSCTLKFNPLNGQLEVVSKMANKVSTVDTAVDLPPNVPVGSIYYVVDEEQLYTYNGTTWNTITASIVPTFSTIAVDSGTNPTATANGETLTITSSDSSISIEGDQATDTIDLSVSSSSPGFTWTRAGNIPAGTWLQVGASPSNQASHIIDIDNPKMKKLTIATTSISTFDLEFYERDGATFTLVHTESIAASRVHESNVLVSLTKGTELAVKLSSGAATGLVVDAQLTGGNI